VALAADNSRQQNRQVALSHNSPGRFNVLYIFIVNYKKSPSLSRAYSVFFPCEEITNIGTF
jgi:hypothetical protein